jgi:UDP-arabinose 4-epimerase
VAGLKRILVTGGAGFVGSHIAKALAFCGYEPVTFDNLSVGHRWAVKWGPLIEADLLDQGALDRAFREHAIDAVIHAAGSAYVGESVADPRKYFRNNVSSTVNLLDAMAAAQVRFIVFSSSCTTYGVPRFQPLSEDHPQSAISPYSETKLFIERMLKWCSEPDSLGWVILRYFNAAGADPEGELGEEHDPETHLIPLAIHAALGRSELQVFGTDYPTPDGTAIRDYIHVTDLANAHVAALKHLAATGCNLTVNLGTGQGQSIRDVIRCVEAVSGRVVPWRAAARRTGDPAELVADASRAALMLGWRPQYSDLTTIVETAFRWFESHQAQRRASAV